MAGGYFNQATGQYATVPGGVSNVAGAQYSFAAGRQAKAYHQGAFVWADSQGVDFVSTANDQFNVRAQGGVRFVTGGAGMTVDGQPVGGGGSGWQLGGNNISAGQFLGSINNQPLIFMVNSNQALRLEYGYDSGDDSAAPNVFGGYSGNVVSNGFYGDYCIASGEFTTASGVASTAMGEHSTAGGEASIAMGSYTLASGATSFAAGRQAKAINDGAFVWADSQNADFSSTANDQFLIRAQGGVGINMNNPNGASLSVQGNRTGGWQNAVGWFENTNTSASAAPALRVVCDGGTNLDGALSVSSNGKGLIAEFGNASTFVVTITNDGTIYCKNTVLTSDRNAKENFTELDAKSILAKVVALPMTQWNYKDNPTDVRHIGPMAQDFHVAFGLNGADETHISTVDEGGVALAAIQGLNQKVESENAALRNENAQLKQRLDVLERIILKQKAN